MELLITKCNPNDFDKVPPLIIWLIPVKCEFSRGHPNGVDVEWETEVKQNHPAVAFWAKAIL